MSVPIVDTDSDFFTSRRSDRSPRNGWSIRKSNLALPIFSLVSILSSFFHQSLLYHLNSGYRPPLYHRIDQLPSNGFHNLIIYRINIILSDRRLEHRGMEDQVPPHVIIFSFEFEHGIAAYRYNARDELC